MTKGGGLRVGDLGSKQSRWVSSNAYLVLLEKNLEKGRLRRVESWLGLQQKPRSPPTKGHCAGNVRRRGARIFESDERGAPQKEYGA